MDTSSTIHPPLARRSSSTAVRLVAGVLAAAVVANLGNLVVAAVAHASGVSSAFPPLLPPAFVMLTVLGLIAGAVGWVLVRGRVADPGRTLSRLVPVVLVASFIPDVTLGLTRFMPATTWGGVSALMTMHVLVAAVAVTTYRYVLPLSPRVSSPVPR